MTDKRMSEERLAELRAKWGGRSSMDELFDEIEHLQADAAAMREAMEGEEWQYPNCEWPRKNQFDSCMWCEQTMEQGHDGECNYVKALATTAGVDLLKELEELRAKVKKIGD